jgi:poly-gamma-glutamate capsule biosynthesis protein CapA/YwtB (metallophosphatase superfamily)
VQPIRNLTAENLQVFDVVRMSDFSLGNFEIPITDRGAPVQKLLSMRAPTEVGDCLDALGLDAVTLANNHAPDFGWDGIADTRDALQKHHIKVVGVGKDLDAACTPLIETVNGVRIGVLAFSCLTPTGSSAALGRPGISGLHIETGYEVDPWYQMEEPGDPSCIRIRTRVRDDDLKRAVALVQRLKENCELVVVTVHWGFGSTEALAEYQRPLAEALIDAGAEIVHGHHPHTVQAIGFHKGKPIIFSANVLVGQQVFLDASEQVKAIWRAMSNDGYVALLKWDHDHSRISEIEIRPTILNSQRFPEFALEDDRRRIVERLTGLSAAHGAEIKDHGGRITASPSL